MECRTELHFDKNDLQWLMRCLQIPKRVVCQQGTVSNGMEELYILLRRWPTRGGAHADMAHMFGRNPSELSHFQQSDGHYLRDSPPSY